MGLDEHITWLSDEPHARYCQWIYLSTTDHLYARHETSREGNPDGPDVQELYEQLFDHGIFDYLVSEADGGSPTLVGHADGGKILAGTAEPDARDEVLSRAYSRAQQLLQHIADERSGS